MVLLPPAIVLFVNVSVVALPTNVSVPVGNVIVPELDILEIAGVVNALFVNVSFPANVERVPVVGSVTSVVLVVVNVTASSPEVVKAPETFISPHNVKALAAFLGSIVTTLLAVNVVEPVAICISYVVAACFIPNDVIKLTVPLSIFTFVKA